MNSALAHAAPHLREIAARMHRADTDFLAILADAAKLNADEAGRVFRLYRKNRIVRLDAGIGRWTVSHGAFLDGDVIRRALAHA